MECPSCRAALPEEARFCLRCGAAATTVPAAATDPLRDVLKTALGRQYELARLLGKGGMGAVYLATEVALEREVAIKVLPPDRGATKDSRDRFRREARTAAKLSHPNIVPLHTFGDVEGTLYFVMGYVRGESLAARIRREGRLQVEEARRILVEIADALDYAHKLGIVHRDIKPDNVLLEEGSGRAMLTDFGVAKALGVGQTMTVAGSILGTPHYMSPEQAQGKSDLDGRSDIYSLGVMGFAMLAGRLPFDGATPADVLVQHITKEAPSLASLAPGVPSELTSAITRCLAKDPDQRWPGAKELRDALTGPRQDEVPIQLESLSSLFSVAVACAVGLIYTAAWWLGGRDPMAVFLSTLLGAAVIGQGAILLIKVRALRRAGFDLPRITHAMFRQPGGWFGWYPRRFRTAGDVWDRLPPELSRARAWLGWSLAIVLLVLLPQMVSVLAFDLNHDREGKDPFSRELREAISDSIMGLVMLSAFASFFFIWRWNRRLRSQVSDADLRGYILVTSTGRRSFWSRPEVGALLLPAQDADAKGAAPPTAPQELVQAVEQACRALPAAASVVGEAAAPAARALLTSIRALDADIAGLAGNVDQADIARLTDKLASLGPEGAPDGDERKQMRAMFQTQLEFLRKIEARIEDARTRRLWRVEMLRTLWLAVVDLRATADAEKTTRTTERIRDLVREMEQQVAGSGTVAASTVMADLPTLDR